MAKRTRRYVMGAPTWVQDQDGAWARPYRCPDRRRSLVRLIPTTCMGKRACYEIEVTNDVGDPISLSYAGRAVPSVVVTLGAAKRYGNVLGRKACRRG